MNVRLGDHGPPPPSVALLPDLFATVPSPVADAVMHGLDAGGVGLCVCDGADTIRYANSIYRSVFLTSVRVGETEFAHSVAQAIQAGGGVRLQSMSTRDF